MTLTASQTSVTAQSASGKMTGVARGWPTRVAGAVSATVGAITGLAPHVLHHIGPLAGAAIISGAAGSVLFGALGFALTIPLLLRLRRRFGSWMAPGIALALFAAMFTISTLWIGPAIRGDDNTPASEHEQHDHGRRMGEPTWLDVPG